MVSLILRRPLLGSPPGIDRTGKFLIKPRFEPAGYSGFGDEGLAMISIGGKFGYIDITGQVVIRHIYSLTRGWSEGLNPVVSSGEKWSFIDLKGETVIKPAFDDAQNFSEGLAAVQIGTKWGYIDKTGKPVIDPKFDMATQFSEDLAAVEIQGKWGYINKQGRYIISPDFYNAWPFTNGLAPVVLEPNRQYTTPQGIFTEDVGHKWAYIDKIGRIVLKVEGFTDRVGDFIDGIAKIEFRDGRVGYIDQTGKYIWEPK